MAGQPGRDGVPFLSLQKKRTRPIRYARDEVALSVHAPAEFGLASIWDLVIFAASHLNECIEDGQQPSPRVAFVPYDCLRQLLRHTGGKDYRELADAIRRLYMTTVITNIRTEDGGERPFRWLNDYWIPKKYDRGILTPTDHDGEPDPLRPWEIELAPWLYNAVLRQRECPRASWWWLPPGMRPTTWPTRRRISPAPDDTTPVTREITNACAVIPVEVSGVVGVAANGNLALSRSIRAMAAAQFR